MKISEIRIENFGKFHNFAYKFNGSGIEILNGENEFGKTTLMTFVQRILYGFPDKRKAENMYESNAEPYGGSLLCIADDGKKITIERLKNGRNKTFRIYDSVSGEELEAANYIRQGADFYCNVYMIELKDLLDASSLDNGEIHHHLYGLERAFGAISPLKVHEMLEKNCNLLYRPKGSTQEIPKLAKELKNQEKELSLLDAEIQSLTSQCSGNENLEQEITSLKTQIETLNQINLLKEKHENLLKTASQNYSGNPPDKFLLAKQNVINSLAEQRQLIANEARTEQKLMQEITDIEKNSQPDFASKMELEQTFLQYQAAQKTHSELLLRNKIAAEEYEKKVEISRFRRKIILISSALLIIFGIILLLFKIAPWPFAALPLMMIAYLLTAVKKNAIAPLPDFDDKTQYFERQRLLLENKTKLQKIKTELDLIQHKYTIFVTDLQQFKDYLPEKISRSGEQEIAVLQQKLAAAVRSDIQLEIHRRNADKAHSEADAVFAEILQLQNANININGDIETLKENLEIANRKANEFALLNQQLMQKTEIFNDLQLKYTANKNNFNTLCRNYLKWKNALNIWDKTIARFEVERQGEVMQTASKYMAKITSGTYTAVRNSVVSGDGLVIFDGKNNKTIDKLSSGTREQLLFVLRLALIEYIEKNAPQSISMPLLMDDIFVNYDERREQNAWDLLAEFAEKRQIIFCRAKAKM